MRAGALGDDAATGLAQLEALLEEEGAPVAEFVELVYAHRQARTSDQPLFLAPIADSIRQHPRPFDQILPRLSLFGIFGELKEGVAAALQQPPPSSHDVVQMMSDGSHAPGGKSTGLRIPRIRVGTPLPPPPPVLKINGVTYRSTTVSAAIEIILRRVQPVFDALEPRPWYLGWLGPKKPRHFHIGFKPPNGFSLDIANDRPGKFRLAIYFEPKDEQVMQNKMTAFVDQYSATQKLSWQANRPGILDIHIELPAERADEYKIWTKHILDAFQEIFTAPPQTPFPPTA